jgi:regulator of cell morphogenesis and NO signaling
MQLDSNRTVRDFALEYPNATRIFEKHGIDYCCGGGKSLREACAAANISPEEVLSSLSNAPRGDDKDPQAMSASELIEHIVVKHHTFVRQELPRLTQLAAKVNGKHGERHPELAEVEHLFSELAGELSMHLMKEEQVLFPFVAQLDDARRAGHAASQAMFGTVRNPIQMMFMEHDAAGEILKQLRTLTANFTPPEDACTSYRVLYQRLLEFEQDLHQHIHLENNILFPKAVELEQEAVSR